MNNNYYLTTTLPYVNADPHIGFALEIVQADAIIRYKRLQGLDVFFNTGVDEHGLKILRVAEKQGMDTQKYCDEYAERFKKLENLLNLDHPTFIRTTDKNHKQAAQKFWNLCYEKGDIYKKNYKVKYCVGCELEKTDSELSDDGRCPVHPNMELELIEEENYFFRFSKYQQALLDYYDANPDFVVPNHRFNEIKTFVKNGLNDFSISRLKEKMPWGVEVPNDSEHVMYVWFDALVNYISTLGWPNDKKKFNKYWPGIQVAGKDNIRQQAAMWQAMLVSAGLTQSKQIFIHGFITSEGEKMSKSRGNVVDPYKLVYKYGIDAVRYYLLGAMPAYEDGDYTKEKFEEYYTAHLVNGVGNLTYRILTMIEKYSGGKIPEYAPDIFNVDKFWHDYMNHFDSYRFDELVNNTQIFVSSCDEIISSEKPWEKVKQGGDIDPLLYQLSEALRHIALSLLPIIPEKASKIFDQLGLDKKVNLTFSDEIKWGGLRQGSQIEKDKILFERL